MQVTVELFSYFRQGRSKQNIVELSQGATVADLLMQLQINLSDVDTLVINGTPGTVRTLLQSGDRVTLIPIIGGG
jgi:molybdopterin converting factor small subunit